MSEKIKVEKGIPIPESISRGRYPFGEMDIGDSFLVPLGQEQLVRMAAAVYKRRHEGWMYKTKRSPDLRNIRLWRIS